MKDQNKTKQELIEELEALRKQVTKLKGMETKRKHAEDALLFTRFSLDNSVDTMVCVDRDAVFIDVNDAFCRSSGYSREELLSMTVHDIDPDYSAEIWPEFWEKLKQSGSLTFETCHRSKEGRIFPVEITANYLEYNGKEYHCLFARDITERKRAEESLKKSEERFRTSVETLLVGFAILSAVRDSNGQIIDFKYEYINEAGCKMNQKPHEEHMGKTLLELLPTHKKIGLFDEYVRVVETGQPLTKEFLIYETVYGGGERLRQAFDVRITRLGDGFVTTWQDITDKKKGEELLRQSEERLKLLIENSKDVVIMADLEGSAMYYNGPPEYGITAEEVLGKNPFSIFEPAIAASLMNQLKLVIKGGEALTFENNIPWRGESFWFLNQMYPIRDEKGRMSTVGLIARNITERKRAEDREQLAHEVLNLLNRWETTTDTIREILLLLKKKMGFEAVGIRLQEGDDFPYFETNGFSEDFVQAERHLCAYDKEGKIVRDGKGNPVLECMCGNILCGRTDAALPSFTAGGSFWTNSTTDLLASTTEEDRQSRTRNRCNGEGYESVALIPLRSGDEIIGLLQLNDRRRNQFTPEMIHFFEGVGASVGIALSRKRAEEAVRESLNRWQTTFDGIKDSIFLLDKEGVISQINKNAAKLFGKTEKEIQGHHCWEIVHGTSEPIAGCPIVRMKQSKQRETMLLPVDDKWYEVTVDPLLNQDGNLLGAVHIISDITERKRAEEEYKTILRTAMDGFWVVDIQGRFLDANDAYCRLIGYRRDEMLTMRISDVEAVETPGETAQRIKKIMEVGGDRFETRHRCKNGRIVDVEISVNYIDAGGGRLVVFARDITERKQAEEALRVSLEKYRVLFESFPLGITISDKSGKIIEGNRQSEQLLGITREAHAQRRIDSKKWQIIRKDGTPMPAEEYASVRALKGNRLVENVEMGIVKDKGEITWISVTAAPIPLEGYGVAIAYGDITERKQAEEALRESEERYRSLFKNMLNGYAFCKILVDEENKPVDFIYIDANDAFEKLTGLRKEDVIGKRVTEVIPSIKDLNPELIPIYGEVASTGKPAAFEFFLKPLDIWLTISVYSPHKDYFVAIFDNITERKQAEEALRRKSGEQALLLDNIQTQIWYLTDKETYGAVNKARAEFFGKKNEEMENKKLYDVLSKDEAEICMSGYAEVFEKRKQIHTEEWIANAKSEKRLLSIIKSPKLDENGDVEYVVCSAEDITERKRVEEALKKSEALYKEAQRTAHIGHWELDRSMMVPTWSEEIFRIFGLDPQKDPPSFAAHQKVTHPDDWDILNNAVTTSMTEGIPFDIEFRILRPDKSIRWMNAKGYATRNSEGRIVRLFGTAQDITEREQAEKERERLFGQVHASRERLRNLSRRLVEVQEVERRELVRKLHDEVGQSLTALSINLNIVHNQLPPETATKMATRIDDSLKLVEETVERIRDVMAELRPPVLDDYGVSATLHWYGKQFSERTGIPTVLKVEELKPRLPLPAETALFRIAQEALTNVAKYAQAKNVTVGLKEFDKVIYLTIADDGVGFDPTAHHQPGARPEWGLINMRERAQTVGGTLNIETAPGKGTRIMVEVPRNR